MRPIGTYSSFVKAGNTVYISGQIPVDPDSGELVQGNIKQVIARVFQNLQTVVEDAGADLNQVVKLMIYVTDLKCFEDVNAVMQEYFSVPYPARALVEVSRLPKDAPIEMDAIVVLGGQEIS